MFEADAFARATEELRPDKALHAVELQQAAALLGDDRPDFAEEMLRQYLQAHPGDPDTLNLMAEAARRQERHEEEEQLLAEAVAIAPDLSSARFNYANVLLQLNKGEAALEQLAILLLKEPQNPLFLRIRAKALDASGKHTEAAAGWRALAEEYPGRSDGWISYGHSLRFLGRQDECVAAYRKALELRPSYGAAYWSLANLKKFRFGAADIEQIHSQLRRSDLPVEDRVSMHFSLGKAYGDLGEYAKSFENYARGNALFRVGIEYDPEGTVSYVSRCKDLLTPAFFRDRAGIGCRAADPIFIVGMPRSGSTLLEQILSSHSAIEGTAELPNIPQFVRDLERRAETEYATDYPGILERLDSEAFRAMGERYMEDTRVRRSLDRTFFTDKMLGNALHVPLIHLMLPNAKIIDARRHPLACCFSNFTQHFGINQRFTYRLTDVGCCYRAYVDGMAHFDRVLPGRVHRVFYEQLVAEPEAEVRRLLDYLGLPFEPACLEFYKTERVVTTVSSEQVRSPLYRDSLEQWRAYEPWLGPLKAALGSIVESYPEVPSFD